MKLLVILLSCVSLFLLNGCNRTGRAGSEVGDTDTTQEGEDTSSDADADDDNNEDEDDENEEEADEDNESVPSHPELNSQLTPEGVENYNTLIATTDTSRVEVAQYTCTLEGNPTPLVLTLRVFSRQGRGASSVLCDVLKDGDTMLLYARNNRDYCQGRLTDIIAYLEGRGEEGGQRVESHQVMECHQDGQDDGSDGEE